MALRPLRPARNATSFVSHPLHPEQGLVSYSEPDWQALAWRTITALATLPEQGLALFPGTVAERRRIWREFSSFIAQARSYWDAARATTAPSSALLYYYAFLNLAKAELLRTHPAQVIGRRIGHGLTMRLRRVPEADRVRTNRGVFPLLYRVRTGQSIREGTDLPVKRLMAMVPELGTEVTEVLKGDVQTQGLLHAIALSRAELWSVLAFHDNSLSTSTNRAATTIRQNVRFVSVPDTVARRWRDVFGMSARSRPPVLYAESITTRPVGSGAATEQDVFRMASDTWRSLTPFIEESTYANYDAFLSLSLFKSRTLPMPPSLGRYALVFYLSSLVRYQPSRADRRTTPTWGWMLEAFVEQSAMPLLHNALSGLLGKPHRFLAPVR